MYQRVPRGDVANRIKAARSRLQRSFRGVLHFVGNEVAIGIEVERDARCRGLERVGVDVAYEGYESDFVGRILDRVAARLEEMIDAREGSARRKLLVEQFVDLLQALIGSVSVSSAAVAE
jgi:hypothetical protein